VILRANGPKTASSTAERGWWDTRAGFS
jgi:hypothetical protein